MRGLIGRTLGHYRIVEKIGEGGMGEVYRAHDERLDRDVAIKVLPSSVAQDPERIARFEREAKAVAKLAHPNILEIWDYGTDEGVTYSVTELLDGETLRERLEGGALSWRKAAEIGAFIADGLAAAHGAGIIHRDLKPDNVFLTSDGRVKILDFGLARDVAAAAPDETHSPTVSRYTDPGAVMGTAGYMSPEQVRGEPTDARSDIFALGSVLYEMATGRRAFARDTAAETMTAILKEEPSDLSVLISDIPLSLADIIRRCLEKKSETRFQTGQDLAFAVRSIVREGVGPAVQRTSGQKSIAVLPFVNLSPDPENEYFADGLTDELITDLSRIGSLRVISRTSAFAVKGMTRDVATVAEQLGVRYVLEGSVRRAGDRLRITAQLIDSTTDAHLWAEKYDGTVEDVFDIQENLSRSIVGELRLRLTPDEDQKIAERAIDDIRAYDCFLRARQEIYKFSDAGLSRALQLIRQALEIVGDNELLYATMGQAFAIQLVFGQETDPKLLQEVERCAEMASALNSESAHGFNLQAMIHYKKGERVEAARLFKKVLAIDPNNSDALVWLTSLYCRAGKAAPQRPLVQKLLEIDPLSSINHTWTGWIGFWETGSFAPALESFRRMNEMDPSNPYGQWWYAYFLAQAGRSDEAFGLLDLLVRNVPNIAYGRIARFFRTALGGDGDAAIDTVSQELEGWASWDDGGSMLMADCFALVDDTEQAMDWMENSIRLGFINYRHYSLDRFLDGLRSEERFLKIMEALKHQWERFEV
jgi:serine/threonine protein kinase/tetratricopeptide (TPR) repeat protein